MKIYRLSAGDLEKFLHQNKVEVIDCIEGCLLDNLLCCTRRGVILLQEHYINEWSSDYMVYFAPYGSDDDIYQGFEALRAT